jgi:hypothetical protein
MSVTFWLALLRGCGDTVTEIVITVEIWVTAAAQGSRRRGSVNPWATMGVTVALSGQGSVRQMIERHVSHLSL